MARSWGSQAGFDNRLTRSFSGGLRDEKLFAGTAVTALSALFGLAGSLALRIILYLHYRIGGSLRFVFFGIMIFVRKGIWLLAARVGRSLDPGTWRD
jgi:hypothetical protein